MKLMLFLNRPAPQSTDAFRESLLSFLDALPEAFTAIRLALADEAVAPAQPLAMLSTAHPHDAMVSVKVADGVDSALLMEGLRPLAAGICAYQVDEREPLHYEAAPGRVEGMCQVAMFRKPAHLTREQWLDIWLNSHTQVAIDTQSTFSYRQNVVAAVLPLAGDATYVGPVYDAIVEEQFPAAAMTDRSAFYAAPGDTARYKANEQAMIESVMRFIDFAGFECVPMSEYRLR
ncbi:MAG: EthD domain-containing protein [Cellvibrionales bacterium]|nr:EthD domain-containing protein [Cellvibrionales bacterium]